MKVKFYEANKQFLGKVESSNENNIFEATNNFLRENHISNKTIIFSKQIINFLRINHILEGRK